MRNKNYDFKKAKQLIEERKESIKEASLGMHEDWFWTAETIWEDGEYKRELPDNAEEIYKEYVAQRTAGMSLFSEDAKKNMITFLLVVFIVRIGLRQHFG